MENKKKKLSTVYKHSNPSNAAAAVFDVYLSDQTACRLKKKLPAIGNCV